jgi:hypothetical protein
MSARGGDGWQNVGHPQPGREHQSNESHQLGPGEKKIKGKVVYMAEYELFMESRPGQSDVFVSLNLFDEDDKIEFGDILTVAAILNVFKKCRWKATRVLDIESRYQVLSGVVSRARDHEDYIWMETGPVLPVRSRENDRENRVYAKKNILGIEVHEGGILTVRAFPGPEGGWMASRLIDYQRHGSLESGVVSSLNFPLIQCVPSVS